MRSFIKTTLLLLALLLPAVAAAYDFEVDGIYYIHSSEQGNVEVAESPESARYAGHVTIPETVTYNDTTYCVTAIGTHAFYYCNRLTGVTIPNSVTVIRGTAFFSCSGLTSIKIPSSVTYIAGQAFTYCDGLMSLTIPSSVTYIGFRAFEACSALTSITVESGNPKYDSRDHCNAIIETASNTLMFGCKNTMIPNTITTIGDNAFNRCYDLTEITIPNSVTYISTNAFKACRSLASVTIPKSVISIGSSAFVACNSLASITVESGNPKYDSRGGCNAIIETASNTLVVGCKNTVIPNSVTCIDSDAFSQCFGLTRISIPASITCIRNWAFFDCSYLRDMYCHITDPSSVLIEGNYTFYSNSGYSGRTLHVPQGSAVAYQADSRWYPYFEKIVEIDADTGLKGDVNLDGEITIADINVVVAIILGENASTITADVNRDGEITIADINAIIEIILHPAAVEEHEWVDLGLPSGTLWATCNVGATSPEEYGDYYAWGETEPKQDYSRYTYKWLDASYTKYCTSSEFGTVDGKTELDLDDDAAHVNWGVEWRTPSKQQMDELIMYCSWQWTTVNGVDGRLVTGRNGNSIFLPAAGNYEDTSLLDAGVWGHYTSRSLCIDRNYNTHPLNFNSGGALHTLDGFRCKGRPVRAVRAPEGLYLVKQSIDFGKMGIGKSCSNDLTIINNTPEKQTLTITVDEPFTLTCDGDSASSLTIVVPRRSSVQVTVNFTATAPGQFDGNVTFQSPALDGGQSVVTVHASVVSHDEYVDLGLPSGTLWASCNVGATSPEDYGDFFAWGETESKQNYTWETYKWSKGSDDSLTKYCSDGEYGTVDYMSFLEPQDDAARMNMGQQWQTPTMEQIIELRLNCTCVWTQRNGVNGYLLTGRNGNSIFLPAAGYRTGNVHIEEGEEGCYWTRELDDEWPWTARSLSISFQGLSLYSMQQRYRGLTVRAVRAPSADFYIEEQDLDLGVVPLGVTSTDVLTIVNNTPEEMSLTITADEPFLLKHGGDSVASMDIVVPGNTSVPVIVMFNGTTNGQFDGNVTIHKTGSDEGQIAIPAYVLAYAEVNLEQDYVDLGLPSGTLWASCNVGATSPEGYGGYYAWGETEPKQDYSWQTYKWCKGSEYTLTKYCTNSDFGTMDSKTELEHEDDAAFVNMGPSWRMPTQRQLEELRDVCTWKSATVNGEKGHLVIGPNGNSLFLPLPGERWGTELEDAGWVGYYWSREIKSYDDPDVAYCTNFGTVTGSARFLGYSVRAVRLSLDDIFIEQSALDLDGVLVGDASTGQLTLVNNTQEPITVTAAVDAPFSLVCDEGNTSSMTIVVPGKSIAHMTVMFTAATPGLFDGNVTFQHPALDGGQLVIPVRSRAFTDELMHQDYIDLGLPSGTLWATRDVGASSPEQYGNEFIWGHTNPLSGSNMSTRRPNEESTEKMTWNGKNDHRGMLDGLPTPGYEFGPGSDAASVNWGPEWRTPSLEQIAELIESCTCSRARVNGVIGRLVTGPNGNCIFMGIDGYYWSRTSVNNSTSVFGMHLQSFNLGWGIFWGPQGWGSRVRAVRSSQN